MVFKKFYNNLKLENTNTMHMLFSKRILLISLLVFGFSVVIPTSFSSSTAYADANSACKQYQGGQNKRCKQGYEAGLTSKPTPCKPPLVQANMNACRTGYKKAKSDVQAKIKQAQKKVDNACKNKNSNACKEAKRQLENTKKAANSGAQAQPVQPSSSSTTPNQTDGTNDKCGSGDSAVKTSINIGCQGKGNGILDMLFAFIRFLSAGVGLIIAGSLVFAGIQYATSQGDPQGTAAAKDRIQNSILALFMFIFAYAILNYVVPGAVLR